jgi:preprotein translocase subunit SecB
VEILGRFSIDTKAFPVEHVPEWARTNAPIMLFPYLREHVYSLTLRAGFKPAVLPLITVPTIRVGSAAVGSKG